MAVKPGKESSEVKLTWVTVLSSIGTVAAMLIDKDLVSGDSVIGLIVALIAANAAAITNHYNRTKIKIEDSRDETAKSIVKQAAKKPKAPAESLQEAKDGIEANPS